MYKSAALAAVFAVAAFSAALAQTETAPPAETAAPAVEAEELPPLSDAPVINMRRRCNRNAAAMQYYPQRALDRLIGGRALMECGFNAAGEIQTSQVIEEEPVRYGFGDAALNIACRTNLGRPSSDARIFTRHGSDLTYRRWPLSFSLEGQRNAQPAP